MEVMHFTCELPNLAMFRQKLDSENAVHCDSCSTDTVNQVQKGENYSILLISTIVHGNKHDSSVTSIADCNGPFQYATNHPIVYWYVYLQHLRIFKPKLLQNKNKFKSTENTFPVS